MLAEKKRVSFNNCNKFANFADYIDQNGVLGTSVDKLAEVRTPDSATCGLKSYGKNISDSLKEGDDRILGSPVTLRWSYSEAKAIDESLAYA